MPRDDEHPETESGETPPTSGERRAHAQRQQRFAGERYRIVDKLGQGGMGEILDVQDRQIGREVAIKCMLQTDPSDRSIQRFLREAKIQGRLEHPSIVPVHELGRGSDGRPYFAMKKLAGTTLAKLLKTDAPRQRLLRAFTDVCLAVELAHTRGFVHRDLKPENIMLGDYGETYVLDWGVAKVIGTADDIDDIDSEATLAGTIMGTPGYMSPEQARAIPDIDARSDVYSLGCVLFEILTRQPLHPRGKEGLASVIANIDCRPSHRGTIHEIPPELDELVVRATAFDRADRIGSARALAEAVQRYLDGDRDLVQRRALARERLSAAEAAFATNDRGTATREAGRALALDPMLRDATDLLSRLLLEPPKVLPPAVQQQIEQESRAVIQLTARAGWVSGAGYMIVSLLLLALGSVRWYLAIPMLVLAAFNAGFLFRWTRSTSLLPQYGVFATSVVLIALSCRIVSPWMIGPGLAAVTACGVMAGSFVTLRHAAMVFVGTFLGVLVPWIGERVGWWSPTMSYAGDDLVIDAPIWTGTSADPLWFLLITTLFIGTTVAFTRGIRISERSAREQLHLMTWQLRHLVPE